MAINHQIKHMPHWQPVVSLVCGPAALLLAVFGMVWQSYIPDPESVFCMQMLAIAAIFSLLAAAASLSFLEKYHLRSPMEKAAVIVSFNTGGLVFLMALFLLGLSLAG